MGDVQFEGTPEEWDALVERSRQNKLITEIMEEDAKDGLYNPGTLSVRNQEVPFNVTFRWGGKIIIVELENGEDVLKLADVFSNMLSANNILHKVINQ
jgi:hypothetical protein